MNMRSRSLLLITAFAASPAAAQFVYTEHDHHAAVFANGNTTTEESAEIVENYQVNLFANDDYSGVHDYIHALSRADLLIVVQNIVTSTDADAPAGQATVGAENTQVISFTTESNHIMRAAGSLNERRHFEPEQHWGPCGFVLSNEAGEIIYDRHTENEELLIDDRFILLEAGAYELTVTSAASAPPPGGSIIEGQTEIDMRFILQDIPVATPRVEYASALQQHEALGANPANARSYASTEIPILEDSIQNTDDVSIANSFLSSQLQDDFFAFSSNIQGLHREPDGVTDPITSASALFDLVFTIPEAQTMTLDGELNSWPTDQTNITRGSSSLVITDESSGAEIGQWASAGEHVDFTGSTFVLPAGSYRVVANNQATTPPIITAEAEYGHLYLTAQFTDAPPCPADLDGNDILDLTDITVFITAFTNQDPIADFDGSGVFDLSDITGFITAFQAGCP